MRESKSIGKAASRILLTKPSDSNWENASAVASIGPPQARVRGESSSPCSRNTPFWGWIEKGAGTQSNSWGEWRGQFITEHSTPGVHSACITRGVNTGLRILLPALSWPVRPQHSRRRSSLAGSFPYCQLTPQSVPSAPVGGELLNHGFKVFSV
jgi:hypothetical protein